MLVIARRGPAFTHEEQALFDDAFAAAYAAVGSMCSTVQETQQSHTPITLLIAAGLFCMFALLSEPAGTLARTLSLVPFVAPFVTPVS